jgi:predicted GIY-YIG superfamily endonuclease
MFEDIKKNINDCKAEIIKIKRELKSLPEGYLSRKDGYYYHGINGNAKGITKDLLLIGQLARKAYLKRRLKYLEVNLVAYEGFSSKCNCLSPEEIIKSLSRTYQQLPVCYFFKHGNIDWQNQPYEINPYYPEQRSIITNNGIAVRSKSELIIANALELNSIPYRYEAALELGMDVKYPDFTIKRPTDGKLIYWEHFGLMDQADYMKNMASKIHFYAKNNIAPLRDLICTYEEDIRNSKRISQLIKWFFIQN